MTHSIAATSASIIQATGLGNKRSSIRFYIANRPAINDYLTLETLRPMQLGELRYIVNNTSNHWRKVFNVYAKLLFDWYKLTATKDLGDNHRWQGFRDEQLFQEQDSGALLFSPPNFSDLAQPLHIIAGKQYAASLKLPPLTWVDNYFAINTENRLIVAPYPDYRQLSNVRIAQLIEFMGSLGD